jgi:hypothetical protein
LLLKFKRYFFGCFKFGKSKKSKEEDGLENVKSEDLNSVIRKKYENLGPTT